MSKSKSEMRRKNLTQGLPMEKPRIKIENWHILPAQPFWGVDGNVLVGQVQNHPRLPEESRSESRVVRTSLVVKIDLEAKICETENSIYELGEPGPAI